MRISTRASATNKTDPMTNFNLPEDDCSCTHEDCCSPDDGYSPDVCCSDDYFLTNSEIGSGFPSQSLWALAWCKFRENRIALAALACLILIVFLTLAAPWIAPYNPTELDYDYLQQPPSSLHWAGTDDLGRDVLSRVLWGGRETLGVGMLVVLIGMAGGLLFGFISGYYGGLPDDIIQRIVDVFLAFPPILLMISIVTIMGNGLPSIVLAVGIANIPSVTRFVRGLVMATRNEMYIEAAHILGVPKWKIMVRHILPNIVSDLIIFSSLMIGGSIMVTSALSYLGLGAQPPSPEWGAMLNYGRKYLRDAWWMSVFPGLAIALVIICVNLLGDALRDALDPKLDPTIQ